MNTQSNEHDHRPFHVEFGDELLNFRGGQLADPVPSGLQILEAAGVHPTREFSVFQLLSTGRLESLRPDETTGLRMRGVEKFIIFHSDRSFRFDLDGTEIEWGTSRIQGRVLKTLAKVDPSTYGVWQEVPGHDDLPIANDAFADLTTAGVERFFTGLNSSTEGA
jgi:hypothetical protein